MNKKMIVSKWAGVIFFCVGGLLASTAITIPLFAIHLREIQLILGLTALGVSWYILRRY